MMDRARIADDDGMRRDVTIDKGARRNQDIVSDGNLPDDRGIDTDAHTTADGRNSLPGSPAFRPDSHPFMKMTVVAQDSVPIYGDIVGMSQIKAFSNPGATGDLDPVLSRMNTEQGFVQGSGEFAITGLSLPEKEMP